MSLKIKLRVMRDRTLDCEVEISVKMMRYKLIR